MSLSAVHMPADVYCACCLHSLSVEEEEIMGLLIGKRSDKKKDRVEISTEQLNSAIMKTSELSESMGESVNVLGWYHSHPHITVQPSHVDLRTQASYQMLDGRFVGIIFSVFNEDRLKSQEIQVTCFQAVGRGEPYEKVEVPLYIEGVNSFSAPCSESIFQLPQIISQEDIASYLEINKNMQNVISKLQNDAAFVMSQCHILTSVVNPLVRNAELRLLTTHKKIEELKMEEINLLKQLHEASDMGK